MFFYLNSKQHISVGSHSRHITFVHSIVDDKLESWFLPKPPKVPPLAFKSQPLISGVFRYLLSEHARYTRASVIVMRWKVPVTREMCVGGDYGPLETARALKALNPKGRVCGASIFHPSSQLPSNRARHALYVPVICG